MISLFLFPMSAPLAGILCSAMWQSCSGTDPRRRPEAQSADEPREGEGGRPCAGGGEGAGHNADPVAAGGAGAIGVRCSYSVTRLLLELAAAAARQPSGAAAAKVGTTKGGGNGGGGPQTTAAGCGGPAALISVMSEALLVAFDRDPSGGEVGTRLLLAAALTAVPEVPNLEGADGRGGGGGGRSGGGGGGWAARGKRPRADTRADNYGGGDGAVEHRRLLTESLTQAVCTATAQLDSPPLAAAALQVGFQLGNSLPETLRPRLPTRHRVTPFLGLRCSACITFPTTLTCFCQKFQCSLRIGFSYDPGGVAVSTRFGGVLTLCKHRC
jgi:hypothetical protein